MTPHSIHQLISRFYSGATTQEEYDALKRYFTEAHDIPAELAADRELFMALAERHITTPPGLADRISAAIDSADTALKHTRRPLITALRYASAAAVMAILFSLALYLLPGSKDRDTQMLAQVNDTTPTQTADYNPQNLPAAHVAADTPAVLPATPVKAATSTNRSQVNTTTADNVLASEQAVIQANNALALIAERLRSAGAILESADNSFNESKDKVTEKLNNI
ncbi:MAG: hypothetical protein NC043_03045 [Muribaculaceae bacterium]|nr:hypothetical protein [Muribaculaceae bacterium]